MKTLCTELLRHFYREDLLTNTVIQMIKWWIHSKATFQRVKDEDFESDFEEAHSTKTLNVKQRLQANPDFMQKLQAKIIRSKESNHINAWRNFSGWGILRFDGNFIFVLFFCGLWISSPLKLRLRNRIWIWLRNKATHEKNKDSTSFVCVLN